MRNEVGDDVIKYFILTMILILFGIGCSGRSPEPTWTAEEYYHYAIELYEDQDYFEATNEFTVIILRYPGSTVADSAQYFLGMSHYMLDEFIISAAEFSKLVNNMPQSPLVPDAQYMLGMSYYNMSPRPALDQEYTEKALRAFQLYVEDFPGHKNREEVEKKLMELREKLAEKAFLNAELYRKMVWYQSSLIYYDIVLERYYDTSWADDAMLGKAIVYTEIGEWQEAKKVLLELEEKFPNTDLSYTITRYMRKVETSEDEENGKDEKSEN
jgi:outer membrane protein assembly factor BamD